MAGIELAQRFKGDECRKCVAYIRYLKGEFRFPTLPSWHFIKEGIRSYFSENQIFLYLLVWRSLFIIVPTAAASSASRWIARPFLQSDSFLNLVSQELKTSVVSCCLNIPSGLLVQKGYGFCGLITYHLMSLPVQGKAWSFCNKREAWETKETKQNPWIKIFCIFSVLHRERSQWAKLCFQPSLALGWRAWQRQSHNYILIKTNKVGKQFYCLIVPKCWSTCLFHHTISTGEREEQEITEEERDRNKTALATSSIFMSYQSV